MCFCRFPSQLRDRVAMLTSPRMVGEAHQKVRESAGKKVLDTGTDFHFRIENFESDAKASSFGSCAYV